MNRITKWILRILAFAPAITLMFVIFGFSGQDGDTSSGLSGVITAGLLDFANKLGWIDIDNMAGPDYAYLFDNLSFIVRKLAHMGEYCCLTGSLIFALLVNGLKIKWALIASATYSVLFAITDEIHQLFVPGRSGKAVDVLIDSVGIAICLLLVIAFLRIKNGKNIPKDNS